MKGYTSRELLYLGMTYFSTVLPVRGRHLLRGFLYVFGGGGGRGCARTRGSRPALMVRPD